MQDVCISFWKEDVCRPAHENDLYLQPTFKCSANNHQAKDVCAEIRLADLIFHAVVFRYDAQGHRYLQVS